MAMPSPKDHPLAPPGVLCPDDYVIPRLASGPVFADAQSASLRENHFSRHPRAFLRKAILPWMALPAEGRAPHAHNFAIGPTPTLAPFGHRLVVNLSGGNEMSRRTYGLATRTRRAHPSEKNASRAIPGPSSARPSCPAWPSPRRGGLRTPAITPTAPPRHVPGWPPGHRQLMWWK